MSISNQLHSLRKQLAPHVSLVAVSKTKPLADIEAAYQAGQRLFGENKIQEMAQKWEQLPKDIEWHMIGHIQTNKIKYMAPFVSLVHGVDRIKVLTELQKQAEKNNRVISCLLQVHIATEETKFGFSASEIKAFIREKSFENFRNLQIKGLMGMASFTKDKRQISSEFKGLKKLYDWCCSQGTNFEVLSMGMSGDYPEAIAQGSNMIRVGSLIFGSRN